MINQQIMNNTINQGVAFLAKEQLQDGSFLDYSTSNAKNFTKAKEYRSVFPSALILSCLNTLKETSLIKDIKQKLVNFLLSQKSEHWSFNYWARDSEESRALPYPDDLDDTCYAMSALMQYNPKLIDGSVMAKVVMLLTAVEEKEGGPYRTWLVPATASKEWQDVDLAVNSNIAYFLSLQDISLPKLNSLIVRAIETNNYYSPNYPPGYPVIYFISRFYKGNKVNRVKNFLISKRQNKIHWRNPLNTALSVLSLMNFGFPPDRLEKSILYLIDKQKKGVWKPYVFNIDPAIKRKTYYAGSPALTTAFCLEALAKYELGIKNKELGSKKLTVQQVNGNEKQQEIYKKVIEKAKNKCLLFDTDLKKQAIKALETTLKINKDKQIVLLPFVFKTALGQNTQSITDQMLVQLGLANLYGWTAYTIYDDFLDDEGDPKLLSTANAFLRHLTIIFNNVLSPQSGFPDFFHQIMDTLDSANTWEVANCRIKNKKLPIRNLKLPDFGDFSVVSHKSLGHALGPLAILFSLGHNTQSPNVKNLIKFFKFFLTAKQLNDDVHDWEQDISKGHISSVNALVLKKYQQVAPTGQLDIATIPNIITDLQKIFWYETIPEICQDILKYINLAKKSLQNIPLITNKSVLEKLLEPIKHSAEQALDKRAETLKFLKAYNV